MRGIGVSWAGGEDGSALDPARLDELGEPVLRVLGLEPLGFGGDLGLDIVAAGALLTAPFLDVVVVGALAGPRRGLVDGDLEARMEDLLAHPAALARQHLGGDVAPPDHRHDAHQWWTWGAGDTAGPTAAAMAGASSPKPVSRRSKARPSRSAAARALAVRAGSSVWAR